MELIAVAKRVVPFLLGLAVGVVPSWIFTPAAEVSPAVVQETSYARSGKYCDLSRKEMRMAKVTGHEVPLEIESKPRPSYTDAARRERVEGTVKLSVEFLSTGVIGDISVVSGLPAGLTDEAVKAARSIKFSPVQIDGRSVDTVKLVEYNFAIF